MLELVKNENRPVWDHSSIKLAGIGSLLQFNRFVNDMLQYNVANDEILSYSQFANHEQGIPTCQRAAMVFESRLTGGIL